MNTQSKQGRRVVGLGACAVTLLALTSTAWAGELPSNDEPPMAPVTAPEADRPTDNVKPSDQSTDRKAKNLVYLELLGNGGLYSINYERMIGNDLSARLGFSYFSVSASAGDSTAKASLVTAPVMLNYMLGGKNHKFETGAGATVIYVSASASGGGASMSGEGIGVVGTGTVGYRYSPADGGFVFRVGYTPFIGANGFNSWGGASFGGTF